MSLDYVKKGESVKATTINSIIDTIGGNQRMSPDLNVTTTPRGAQVYMPADFGGPNNPLNHYLDTGKYTLSGWPFVQLVLGPTLDDCLGVFKYHTVEGDVACPISAGVVFKNSSSSPTGAGLSGYLLYGDEFGLDAEVHAAGWVETMIEDTNGQVPTNAQLWSWNLPSKMAAIFTNVDDELSVKKTLSSLLQDNGVSASELSSLERVGTWRLTSSTSLSAEKDGQVVWIPTHELVNTHDTIDVWASEAIEETHINMAELVCYNIESHEDSQTGKTVLDNVKFAWRYWLGPDSTYEEGETIKFVYSHSWTINGQPAVFKVEDEIDSIDQYDGQTVAIADERGGYSIMYGEFETNSEGEETSSHKVEAGSLFVNFNYYDAYACMLGEFGESNYSTPSDLSKSTFICKQKEEYVVDEISVGQVVPRRFFAYGTFSTVDKDWPLVDKTCPENRADNPVYMKSLQWKDNVPEEGKTEPVDETGTKSMEIYRFAEVIKSQCPKLSDMQLSDQILFLARRRDKDGGAFVEYINMDELSTLVDSQCETLYLSSIQEKTYTFVDDEGVSHSLPYHQLYGFDGAGESFDPNNIDKYEVVVRKSLVPGAIVSYIPLSSVLSSSGDVFTDTQISETSSIQFDDDGNGPYLELFKFNDGDYGDTLELHQLGTKELVVRDGDKVNYITLSGDALSDIIPDATVQDGQKSIDWLTNSHDRVIQLYKFDQAGMSTIPQTDVIANGNAETLLPDEYEFVVRKNGPGGEIEYMQAKLSVQHDELSVDSEGTTGQKSIAFLGDSKELQLYKFNQGGQGTTSALVPTYWEDPSKVLPDNYEFIVRKGGAGGEVEYKKLELKQAQLSVDRNGHPNQRSLQYCDLGNGTFLELDHFHSAGMNLPKVTLTPSADVRLLPNNHEFVIRKKVGGFWQIDYAPLSACIDGTLSANVSVDTDVVKSRRSIEWDKDGDKEYLQLYHFDGGSIKVDPNDWASYDLVIRDFKTINGSIVNYTNLSSLASSMVSVTVNNTVQILSGLSGEPDAKYPQLHLSSIQDDDFVDPKTGLRYHQLFNFQKPAIQIDPNDLDSYDIVIRDFKTDPTGAIVNYTNLSAMTSTFVSATIDGVKDFLSGLSCEPDAKYPELHLSSIQDDDFVDPKTGLRYHQLFNFQNEGIDIAWSDLGSYELVVRDSKADPNGKIVNYAKLSSLVPISCDTDKTLDRKSLDLVMQGENAPFYQLHNFPTSADVAPDTWVMFSDQPDYIDWSIGCQTQFVVRVPDGNGGYEIDYKILSAFQEHERVDTYTNHTEGKSVDYTTYDEGIGCYNVLELYNFRWGCCSHLTSADISSYSGNAILTRRWDEYGCCWYLDYMGFDSVKEFVPENIGDSQLNPLHYQVRNRSIDKYWDGREELGRWAFELYDWQTGYDFQNLTIYNDGCTYYWPQGDRTDSSPSEWDYVLVKHVYSNGNQELQYKLLEVTMPNITDYGGDISDIYNYIHEYYDEIQYLSTCIDNLSGAYWESGGDHDTCYGSDIGNSSQTVVIDLDNYTLEGCLWYAPNFEATGVIQADTGFFAGCGASYHFLDGCSYISNSYAYFAGNVGIGCQINIGCTYFSAGGGNYVNNGLDINGCINVYNGSVSVNGDYYGCGLVHANDMEIYQGGELTIGQTSINESQLSALLQLAAQAPQLLQNL